jgi:hypothetical protein
LSVYVGIFGPYFEHDKHFIPYTYCFDSAYILPFCKFSEPFDAFVFEYLPFATESEETSILFRPLGENRLFEILRCLDKSYISRTIVIVTNTSIIQRTWIILSCEQNDITSSMIYNSRSCQLSVSFIIVGPFIVFLLSSRYLWIGWISDTCWTFRLWAVFSLKTVNLFEINLATIESPMINCSWIVISQIHAHKSSFLLRNKAVSERVTWSLSKLFNWF